MKSIVRKCPKTLLLQVPKLNMIRVKSRSVIARTRKLKHKELKAKTLQFSLKMIQMLLSAPYLNQRFKVSKPLKEVLKLNLKKPLSKLSF